MYEFTYRQTSMCPNKIFFPNNLHIFYSTNYMYVLFKYEIYLFS